MDIQTSFNSQILQTMKTLVENNLHLIVGQQIAVKVVAINANGITLKWSGQNFTVENQNPRATFQPYLGQNATLQVTKVTPELEFKLIALDMQSYETPPSAEKMNATRLTLATAPLISRIDESLKNFVSHAQGQQPVEAKIVGLVGHKIQLELVIDDHQSTAGGKKMLISIERNQLQLLPWQTSESLKVGQALTLAITKIGAMPEFKQLSPMVATPAAIQEEKIASFMKQLLPRHESPSVLLNQLRTDLPQLEIKNDSLAATLKQNAAALFEHLQPHEQLFNPQKLKHLIYSSGLFFEAKSAATNTLKMPLPVQTPTATQTQALPVDLKMPLLNLLQHVSATNELKQLASTLFQNLLKQEAEPTEEIVRLIEQNEIELHAQLLPLSHAENIPQSLKQLAADILSNLKTSPYTNSVKNSLPLLPTNDDVTKNESIDTDFKNDLFKLMHTLKQGITQQNELALTETQVDKLQQLQNKTENALAKVVIDQLHSLPKEDSGKQVWAFELPFLMGNQAETLKMEIQRYKANQAVDTQTQHWSVNLTLTPPKLGEVQCVVSYQDGVVNTYFKNEQPQTTALITRNLENLKQQMHKVGLIAGLMSAHNNFQPMKSAYSTDTRSLLSETV